MLLTVSLDLKRLLRWSRLGVPWNAYKPWVRKQIEGLQRAPERKAGISVTFLLTSRRKISLLGPLLAVMRKPSYPSPAWAPRPQAPELEGAQTAPGSILRHCFSAETPQWHQGCLILAMAAPCALPVTKVSRVPLSTALPGCIEVTCLHYASYWTVIGSSQSFLYMAWCTWPLQIQGYQAQRMAYLSPNPNGTFSFFHLCEHCSTG